MWGAAIAFGIITACVSAIREVAAAEAAVITAPGTAPGHHVVNPPDEPAPARAFGAGCPAQGP